MLLANKEYSAAHFSPFKPYHVSNPFLHLSEEETELMIPCFSIFVLLSDCSKANLPYVPVYSLSGSNLGISYLGLVIGSSIQANLRGS